MISIEILKLFFGDEVVRLQQHRIVLQRLRVVQLKIHRHNNGLNQRLLDPPLHVEALQRVSDVLRDHFV